MHNQLDNTINKNKESFSGWLKNNMDGIRINLKKKKQ